MPNILVIDDKKQAGVNITGEIRKAGYRAELVSEDEWQDACNLVIGYLKKAKWDVLVLDINFQGDQFGGIWLYNKLIKEGLSQQWEHTIVYTLYFGADIPMATATDGESFILRTFIDTAHIPYDCVLSSQAGGRKLLVDKIKEITSISRIRNCIHCKRPLI